MPSDSDVSDFDQTWADIPVLGWLTGASGRRDTAYNRADQQAAMRTWRDLGTGPSAEDLTPEYAREGASDEYGDLLGDPSQLQSFGPSDDQRASLEALRMMYATGGYTAADRAAMHAARGRSAQQAGAMNRAALDAMEARGMGGSGAALAAQLGGSQAMAGANVQGDAAVQQAAMMRALQALQGYTTQANNLQAQEFARRSALDAFNQSNNDWRRGREVRNTGTANRQQDANVDARQQSYSNAQNWAAGMTGQYQGSQDSRRADSANEDEDDANLLATVGTIAAAACCSPDTPILTSKGWAPISALRTGDVVATLHGGATTWRPVKLVSTTPVSGHRVMRVALANGARLDVSAPHPTVDGRVFGDLRAGDDLGGVAVVSAELVPYEHARTHDILPDSDSGAYVAAGAWIGSTLHGAARRAA